MRPIALAALALPLALAACDLTPRQQCQAPYRGELRVVKADLRDTELTLRRGFRLVPAQWELGVHYCVGPSGSIHLCTIDDGEAMFDQRPINRAAEQAKLATLKSEEARLTRAIQACAAQFPE